MPPPPPPGEPAGAIAAQFLKFIGLLVTIAGALAILRMRYHDVIFHTDSRSLLYVALMPVGMALWITGFYLAGRFAPRPDKQDSPETPVTPDPPRHV